MQRGNLSVDEVSDRTWRFVVESASRRDSLWYERLDDALPNLDTMDAPLVGTMLHWMQEPVEAVDVAGPVSRSLLRNLDELQHVWARWRPERYRRVVVVPEAVIEDTPSGDGGVSAFSGGVDAAFTVLRHALQVPGHHRVPLEETVMVHGFDIPINDHQSFEIATDRGRRMLAGTSLHFALMRTNIRSLGTWWVDLFALAAASVLLTFQANRNFGLIGSSEPYDALALPWGSTPVQDWMASTGRMEIRHDGAGYGRTEKVEALADWPAALEELRVCWQEPGGNNCGRCEKCIRTILNFRALGLPTPPCFDHEPSRSAIRQVRMNNPAVESEFADLVAVAQDRGQDGAWTRDVKFAIREIESDAHQQTLLSH